MTPALLCSEPVYPDQPRRALVGLGVVLPGLGSREHGAVPTSLPLNAELAAESEVGGEEVRLGVHESS